MSNDLNVDSLSVRLDEVFNYRLKNALERRGLLGRDFKGKEALKLLGILNEVSERWESVSPVKPVKDESILIRFGNVSIDTENSNVSLPGIMCELEPGRKAFISLAAALRDRAENMLTTAWYAKGTERQGFIEGNGNGNRLSDAVLNLGRNFFADGEVRSSEIRAVGGQILSETVPSLGQFFPALDNNSLRLDWREQDRYMLFMIPKWPLSREQMSDLSNAHADGRNLEVACITGENRLVVAEDDFQLLREKLPWIAGEFMVFRMYQDLSGCEKYPQNAVMHCNYDPQGRFADAVTRGLTDLLPDQIREETGCRDLRELLHKVQTECKSVSVEAEKLLKRDGLSSAAREIVTRIADGIFVPFRMDGSMTYVTGAVWTGRAKPQFICVDFSRHDADRRRFVSLCNEAAETALRPEDARVYAACSFEIEARCGFSTAGTERAIQNSEQLTASDRAQIMTLKDNAGERRSLFEQYADLCLPVRQRMNNARPASFKQGSGRGR